MAYNSDGYIMVDFSEVDFRQSNQYIEGLFDRLRKVIGTNKFVLVINANGKTPLPSTVSITNGQYVIESCIFTFSVNSSDMLHIKRNSPDPTSLIDDTVTATDKTWSSDKISGYRKEASDISYDNTSSGLSATDVQTAIDQSIMVFPNAGSHNSIYRGKYLGDEVTADQYAAIAAGTFDDMYIGDYWTINGVNWRIAHFDYWLNCGDSGSGTTEHHVVIVPDSALYSAKMNETDTTTGGYLQSKMRGGITYQGNLAQAKTIIEAAFGSAHILSHRELLSSASDSSGATTWTWADSTVDLISEIMAYGCKVWANSGYDAGIDKEQLALFRHDVSRLTTRSVWWLRSVASSVLFATVTTFGHTSDYVASGFFGVRPAFALRS